MSLSEFLITAAYAQDATTTAPVSENSSLMMNIAPILVIFIIFYFLVIRPQSKRIKAHQDMMGQLQKGDAVVTGGGFLGNVVAVDGDVVTVDLGNGQIVRAVKSTLSGLQQNAAATATVLQDNVPAKKAKNTL